jgi:hypothetical protein
VWAIGWCREGVQYFNGWRVCSIQMVGWLEAYVVRRRRMCVLSVGCFFVS